MVTAQVEHFPQEKRLGIARRYLGFPVPFLIAKDKINFILYFAAPDLRCLWRHIS